MAKQQIMKVALKGGPLLAHPRFNKGSSFTHEERKQLNLIGMLPYAVNTLDEQCERAYDQVGL